MFMILKSFESFLMIIGVCLYLWITFNSSPCYGHRSGIIVHLAKPEPDPVTMTSSVILWAMSDRGGNPGQSVVQGSLGAHKGPGGPTSARPTRAQGGLQGPSPQGPRGAHKGPDHKGPGGPTRARPTRAQGRPQGPIINV